MSLEVGALRAMAHPIRLQMLSLLTGAELSAAEVARELGISQANASYHLRVLAAAGKIVEAGEEKIRGGVAKRYRHPWREEDRPAPLSGSDPEASQLFMATVTQELLRRYRARVPGTPGLTTDAALWVTPEVWERVQELVHEASAMIHDQAQPPHTEATVHVNLTASLFQMADTGAPDEAAATTRQEP